MIQGGLKPNKQSPPCLRGIVSSTLVNLHQRRLRLLTHAQRAERRAKIPELRNEGKTDQEIASILGLSYTYVKLACPRDRHENVNKIRALAAEGLCIQDIAQRLGLSVCYVTQELSQPRRVAKRTLVILAELKKGKSQIAVAKEMGVSRQRVGQVASEAASLGLL